MSVLEVNDLVKHFPLDRRSYVAAVDGVSFGIERGETLGLVGESGSGKTTVGRCILRLIEPTAGRIAFEGSDITELGGAELRRLRARISLVFQDALGSLNPRSTVAQAISEPLVVSTEMDPKARLDRLQEMLEAVRLRAAVLPRYPAELTTSEQQRVALARALITKPSLVVLDEPTSNLDAMVAAEVLDLLQRLQGELGTSYLMVSHDLTAVERISHHVAIMYLGKIAEIGPTEGILARQWHPYSRALLSAVLFPDPRRKLPVLTLEGEIPSAINPPDECPLVGRCPLEVERCREATPPLDPVARDHRAACYRAGEIDSVQLERSPVPVDSGDRGSNDRGGTDERSKD